MSDRKQISKILDCLGENPLFHLMLGSRELFHSNFLFWLMDQDKRLIGRLLEVTVDDADQCRIEREKYGVDLAILDLSTDRILAVVENKVKDMPRRDQLEQYSSKKPFKDADKILLSMEPPQFDCHELGWRTLSYSVLAERINRASKSPNQEHPTIIALYVKLLQDMSKLFQFMREQDKKCLRYWFCRSEALKMESSEVDKKLDSRRLLDIFNKRRAGALLNELDQAIGEDDISDHLIRVPRPSDSIENKIAIHSHTNLMNKNPIVSFVLNKRVNGRRLGLGVQVEGRQYRRFIEWEKFKVKQSADVDDVEFVVNDGTKGKRVEDDKHQKRLRDFVEKTDNFRWLFIGDPKQGHLASPGGGVDETRNLPTRMKKEFCSYAPNFVYRYVDVGFGDSDSLTDAALSPHDLAKTIVGDLKYALDRLRDDGYVSAYSHFKPGESA